VVTATPKGRTVRLRPVPTPGLRLVEYQALAEDCQALPYSLRNIASEYMYRTPHLFMGPMECDHVSDLYFLDIPRPSPGNFINMVSIQEHHEGSVHTLPEDGDSSTGSTRSVYTEVEHLEDDGYDLDLSTRYDWQSTEGYAQGSRLSVDRCVSYKLYGDARQT
jgi:hypothetical protein